MASTPHDGIIDDDRVYTIQALALLLGYKSHESAMRVCEQINCPVKHIGRRSFVAGYEFRLAIERFVPSEDSEGTDDGEI